ncbi:MAG: 50S ribosomal protein L32 [bacterium]|nr:50S ribosomal protein L32 [bacterium]
MRHTRAHTRNRRSHHAISPASLSGCPNCGIMKSSHRVCLNCGKYKGRQVIDTQKKIDKKAKRQKERQKTNP